jgi:uncharacterized membrane protein
MIAATIVENRATRSILFLSLALNLFFAGVAGALFVRHYVAAPAVTAAPDRSPAARIERLAATLPAKDAEVLRAQFVARARAVEAARDEYRRLLDATRPILRTEPFDAAAMRAALSAARGARQTFDQLMHEVITAAAGAMTPEGRRKLADWPTTSRPAEINR